MRSDPVDKQSNPVDKRSTPSLRAEVGGVVQELTQLELARTRPWIHYRTYSWFTAPVRKPQVSLAEALRPRRKASVATACLKSLRPAVPLRVGGGSVPQKENSLPGIGKGGRLFSGTPIDPIYWTKNVALEGADRLPAPSTAMSVIVLSPVWVTYTTARSPVVVWSRTPFR